MEENITPEGTPMDPSASSAPVDSSATLTPTKKSKVRRNVLIAGSAVGLVGIGSTLAANISLNGGNNVEFGQGVAKTTACDADGFTITPVTSYDNNLSIWRLDRIEITGLNLTPVGTGHSDANLSLSDAKTQHPGEYYENGTWKRTCDGVVLDFKAYTDDANYWSSTRDGAYGGSQTISSPVGWLQYQGNHNRVTGESGNFGFAVVFDINDANDGEDSNYGVGDTGSGGWVSVTSWNFLDHSTPANSSFSFGSWNGYKPDAASISKITVSSMAHFSSDYYLYHSDGIGIG